MLLSPPFMLALVLLPGVLSAVLALALSRIPHAEALVHAIGVAGPLIASGAALWLARTALHGGPIIVAPIISIDALSALLLVVIALVSALALLYSIPYFVRERRRSAITRHQLGWYYFWSGWLVATMYATPLVSSLGIGWVLIEATTLVSVPLVALHGTKLSLEAAWKYIVIATVGISFALLGLLLLYVAATIHLPETAASLDYSYLRQHAALLDPGLVKLAFILVLVGYGTKAGLAPMHTWLPDAHSQAPTPSSALLSGALLNCALYGLLRVSGVVKASLGRPFPATLLILFGLLSIATVVPFLIKQADLKRLLAYSSVEHMGIIVLAVGVGGPLGQLAAVLHLLAHALSKGMMFCIAGEVTERYHTRTIVRIRGIVHAAPLLGALLFAGAFAITGVPPFTVFLSEWLVVQAAAIAGHSVLAVGVALLLSAVFAAIVRQVAHMAFGEAPDTAQQMMASAADPAAVLLSPALPALALVGAERLAVGSQQASSTATAPFHPPDASIPATSADGNGSSGTYPVLAWLQPALTDPSGAQAAALAASEPETPAVPTPAGWAERAALTLLLGALAGLLMLGIWIPLPVQQWLQAAGALLP